MFNLTHISEQFISTIFDSKFEMRVRIQTLRLHISWRGAAQNVKLMAHFSAPENMGRLG